MEILCENPEPRELSELIDLVSDAFKYTPPDKVSQDFPLLYAEKNRRHLWIVRDRDAANRRRIVAHAGCLQNNLYIDGFPIAAGGIGGVASHPEARGRGLAKSLVDRCCEDLRSQGAMLAFLWSGEHEFFRKQGFELVGRQWSIPLSLAQAAKLRDAAAALARDEGVPTSEWQILEGAAALGEEAPLLLAQHPLRVERSREEFCELVGAKGVRVFSAHRNGHLSAYILIGKGMDLQGHIHEWAGSELGLLLLLAHALEAVQSDLVLLAPQFTPKEAPLLYKLEQLGFSSRAGYHAMVRLLDFPALRALTVQKARSLAMEPSFLRFERMDDGSYCIGWATDPDLYMSEHELLKFVFGPDLPGDQVSLEPASSHALNSLFPLRAWWWGMDSV